METRSSSTASPAPTTRAPLTRLILNMVLLCWVTAASMTASAAAAAPCVDCDKHTGQDTNLLPKDTTSAPDAGSNSLWGSGGQAALRTGTQSTTLQTGAENTTLQTGTQNVFLQGGTERSTDQTSIEILIDCSQSMKEGLSGQPKMEAAKRVLEETMATIPPDVNVGLRVFGQSFRNDPFLDCQQTALPVPIGTHNRRAMVEHIRLMRPYGLTPLTYALREAASDLEQVGGRKQIILISDGAETCGQDPCALVHILTERGFNIKIDIVGLGLRNDREAKLELNCIANQSGGKFYDSNTAAELVDNLRKITSESKISGKVLTKLKGVDAQQVLPANLK